MSAESSPLPATPVLELSELLHWVCAETQRWQAWFATQPAAVWAVPVDSVKGVTVRDLLYHILMVDLRYGQRLSGQPVSSFEAEQVADPMAIFAIGLRAHDLLAQVLVNSTPADWSRTLTFMTLSAGERTATARKIFAHTLTHHVRHMGQLATILRQHGYQAGWPHDLLMSDALA